MKKITQNSRLNNYGFTIVELLVVIVVIGILASIVIISYTGIQAKARDVSVSSDVGNMDTLQKIYSVNNGAVGKAYQSSSGYDSTLGFKPSAGNVIDVAINNTDYCVRGYNPSGTSNSIGKANTRESSTGACLQIPSPATSLSGLAISVGTIAETFDKMRLTYTATVPNGTTTLNVTPTAQDVTSAIRVNGTMVNSGTNSGQFSLIIGVTNIQIQVKASDNLIFHTYIINVTRAS